MTDKDRTMTITIGGWDAQSIERSIADKIDGVAHEQVQRRLDEAIRKQLETLIDEHAGARIKEAIDGLFAAGWQPTDEMGNPRGERISLSERVRRVLDRRDHYSGSGGTMIEKVITEATTRQLERAITEELAEAKKKLRAAFDDVIKAKFAESLRKAMGME